MFFFDLLPNPFLIQQSYNQKWYISLSLEQAN